jgi:HEAT repeat protein
MLKFKGMKTIKTVSVLAVFILAQALTLCAQTPAAKPAAKKPAAKAAAKPAPKPAAPAAQPAAQPAPKQDPFDTAAAKLKSTDAAERRQGAEMIGQSRNAKGAQALMEALADEAPAVRQAAADALGLLIWRPASPILFRLLLEDKEPAVRQQAAISLSYIMDQAAGPALVKALKDGEPSVAYSALHTLSVLRYAPAEEQIAGLLASKDVNMRRGAIAALGQLKAAKSGAAIVSALADEDHFVRAEAIKAIGNIPYEAGAPELVKLLDKAQQPAVRVEAALALSKMGKSDGLLTAYEFLRSPELSVRSQSLTVLGSVGDARSLQLIEEMIAADPKSADMGMLEYTRQRLLARLKLVQK